MLRFKDIKELAATIYDGSQMGFGPLPIEKLVFPPGEYPYPYEDVVKSDSILEIFFPDGLFYLEGWLLDVYGKILPKYVLETVTFSHLLDIVNGIPDDRHEIPEVFDPADHFQSPGVQMRSEWQMDKWRRLNFNLFLDEPEDLQPGEALESVKRVVLAPTRYSEAEWLEGGHANPLWCKDYLYQKGRDIMTKKNHDYTGGSGDPYANFKGSVEFGIDPVLGILLRVQDKMKRIQTFVEKGELKVQGESLEDALVDVQNYIDLIYGIIKGERDDGK